MTRFPGIACLENLIDDHRKNYNITTEQDTRCAAAYVRKKGRTFKMDIDIDTRVHYLAHYIGKTHHQATPLPYVCYTQAKHHTYKLCNHERQVRPFLWRIWQVPLMLQLAVTSPLRLEPHAPLFPVAGPSHLPDRPPHPAPRLPSLSYRHVQAHHRRPPSDAGVFVSGPGSPIDLR